MKANAPERLYLSETIYSTYLYQVPDPDDESAVEYIRTDAFIEKAQFFLIDKLKEIPMGGGKMKIKADCSLKEFIEDFVKYMK